MSRRPMQQKTERRISATLRLLFAVLLLFGQIALVTFLSYVLRQRMFYVYLAMEVLAVVCAWRIYQRPGSTVYKTGWIFLVLALPVTGLVLCLLWNGSRPSKRLSLLKVPQPQESELRRQNSRQQVEKLRKKYPAWGRLATLLDGRGYSLYSDTAAVYFPSGEAYLEDMLQRLETAEHFIFMEYYIVGQGQIWDRLSHVLECKARAGVEVKLIFDDFGSMLRLPAEEVDHLRRAGAEVVLFNPVHQYVNRLYFNYRDHRKITCIDGSVSYTGGVNLADEYANLTVRFGHWKDCGLRLEGQGAWGLTREFIWLWERLGGTLQYEHAYYRPDIVQSVPGFCQTIADGPDNNPVNTAEDAFLHMIASARNMVYISTPYLAIDEPMVRALCMAGDSGVDVRLLMPGVPDHKFAWWVAESYIGELLEHNVKVYRYEPGLQHGKAVMVDREVAFVGTVNMDYRSFQLHFECGVVLYDAPAIEQILEDMDDIVAQSRCLSCEEWPCRPWHHKLRSALLRPFASWM